MATKHEDWCVMMATKYEDQWARMAEEVDTTFWEVFSETSSIESVRLLLRHISTSANPSALPTCYMSEALATTVQWRVDTPVATTAPESQDSQAPVSTSSLCAKLRLHLFPCQTFPCWHPQSGVHPSGSLSIPSNIMWDCSPNSAPDGWPGKGACAKTAIASVSNGHSTPQGNGKLPGTPLEAPKMVCILLGVCYRTQQWGQHQSLWWWVDPRWIKGECSQLWFGISLWGLLHLFRHGGGDH